MNVHQPIATTLKGIRAGAQTLEYAAALVELGAKRQAKEKLALTISILSNLMVEM